MQGLNHSNALAVLLLRISQGAFLFSSSRMRETFDVVRQVLRIQGSCPPFSGVYFHECAFFENF